MCLCTGEHRCALLHTHANAFTHKLKNEIRKNIKDQVSLYRLVETHDLIALLLVLGLMVHYVWFASQSFFPVRIGIILLYGNP